jgi:hypothetical protein
MFLYEIMIIYLHYVHHVNLRHVDLRVKNNL